MSLAVSNTPVLGGRESRAMLWVDNCDGTKRPSWLNKFVSRTFINTIMFTSPTISSACSLDPAVSGVFSLFT